MLREIVFDTETTGFDPAEGHKLVEIGAVELINHIPTGKTYHQYINPCRDVPEEVVKVHGLTFEFLQNYPKLSEIAPDFINFVGEDGILVAHNAQFDMNFINYEFKHAGFEIYTNDRVVDTLEIAKKKFPGARNNLDALCRRFNIDNSKRTKHGALLDAELLSEVYLELLGGAEPSMKLEAVKQVEQKTEDDVIVKKVRVVRKFDVSEEEQNQHESFLKDNLKEAIWLNL